jgi:hypothetical protein
MAFATASRKRAQAASTAGSAQATPEEKRAMLRENCAFLLMVQLKDHKARNDLDVKRPSTSTSGIKTASNNMGHSPPRPNTSCGFSSSTSSLSKMTSGQPFMGFGSSSHRLKLPDHEKEKVRYHHYSHSTYLQAAGTHACFYAAG